MTTVNDLAKELHEVVAEFEAPSTATQEAYQRDLARLFAGATAIRRKSTHYRYRAALTWYFRTCASGLLAQLHALKDAGQQDVPASVLAQVVVLSDGLSMARPGSDNIADNLEHGRRSPFERQASATSKKDGLRWLPDDWREQMLGANWADPERWLALCVLFLTGLRPAELERGVEVALDVPGDLLSVRIEGAKVRDGRGQPWRLLSYGVHQAKAVKQLRDQLGLKPGGAPVRLACAKSRLRAIMRLTSSLLFEEMPLVPSPVSARHQLAADMKRMHWPQVTIAQALGHRSISTQEHYGHKRFGRRGSVLPKHVSAAIDVDPLYLPHIVVGDSANAGGSAADRGRQQPVRAAVTPGL